MFFFYISSSFSVGKPLQSGRFGKLNKKVTFPETLDLSPYVSEAGDRTDVYRLYAVVVHVDMLNASFFGHYICYIKDFSGNWYRTDDCKVGPLLFVLSHRLTTPIIFALVKVLVVDARRCLFVLDTWI